MKQFYVLLMLLFSTSLVISQNQFWQNQNDFKNSEIKNSNKHLPKNQTYTLNLEAMQQLLKNAPARGENTRQSSVILSFPNSEGEFEQFRIIEASVMAPELQLRYPNIRSYAGQGIEDPSARIRFSVSPQGLHSMRLSANKSASFIVPLTTDNQIYTAYSRADRTGDFSDFECTVTESANNIISGTNYTLRNANDAILRKYRLAVSATGEYTQFHGGTKAQALAAIVTTMTRVNGIFETDFNVNMMLISNTDDVIFTNSGNDPYSTTGNYNGELQSELTSTIGEANYDIGHLFANLQNNGNAGCIGCVCVNNQKGSGWTSATNPIGDFFDVDYVAHEMGHQFGANHTWTHGGNEGSGVQAEPGSGTTIMSYAGITGASTDVEQNVTPNFHALSIEQVTDYVKSTSCQTEIITGNAVPVVVLIATDYTIPKGTAFELDGSATDASIPENTLSYCWEQIDNNGNLSTFVSPTKTGGVAFRAYEPTSETNRYFPRLETIKTGATSWQWEAVPDVARTLNFRFTVRDNVIGGGTNSSGDVAVTVNGVAGPFVVNSPNTNITWNADSFATITWDVSGTTGNGVNAANVDIFLSTDGGDTYPITLATGVTNDGSHDIVVPNNQGTQNRVMVRGANNIFFDISDTDFTIDPPIICTATVPTNFASSNIEATAATLTWDTITSVVFDIQYRVVGSGTWIDVSTSNASFDLTGLTPETDYETQIRSRCANNSTSAYSGIITFTTPALPPCSGTQITSYPYLETFDSGIGAYTQGSGDDGDWILDTNGTPSGNTGPSDDITVGGNYLFLEASSNGSPGEIGANATAVLESPCFDLNGLTEAKLSFYYHMFGVDTGNIVVEVSNDNGASWVNIFTISGNQGDVWNSENIDLATYLNQNIKLRFTGTTGGGFASDMAIDQIRIGPDTEAPVITLNGASTINLNVGSTYSELGATASDNVDGDLTSSIVIGGDTVDPNVTGTYLVTYNVSDAAGNAAVEVIRTVNVTEFQYCDSTGDLLYQTGVTRVIFGTIDNSDGPAKDVGYEDFTNISTDATQGTTIDLTVYVNTDGNRRVHAFVWIDWNKDGDFDDSGEEYDLGDIKKVADGPLPTLPITIPESMIFGNTRMRVSAQFGVDPTSCLTGFDGEVEDYTVNVKFDGLLFSGGTWDPSAPSASAGSENVLVLDGTYQVISDVVVNDLTVNTPASIEVNPSQSIFVNGDLTNSGNLILNSVSNGYSSLIVDGTLSVSGDIKYKRHVNAFTASAPGSTGGNDLISAPVVGQAFGSFATDNPNIFENPSTPTQKLFGPFNKVDDWYQIYDSSADAAVTLDSGIGYRAARDASEDGDPAITTFTFTGSVNTGPINIGIQYQGTTYPEWNLIGNPYPSYIKLDAFLAANNLNVFDTTSAGVYGYDGDASDGWIVWNQAFSDNYKIENPGSELLITPGQGFFVASQSGGATVSFTSSMRSIGSDDDFIANKNSSISHLKLEVNSSSEVYTTDFYVTDNASLGLDPGYDASVFGDVAPDFAIYSQLVNDNQGIDMAIQSVNYADLSNNVIIPLGINASQGQQLTVRIVNTTLPENTNVYLEDNVANTTTLLNTNDYVFTPDTNLSDVGRFFLRFETEILSVIENELNELVIYNTNSPKVLHIKGQLTESATLYLYDIHGRTVLTDQLKSNTNSQQIDISNISTGVYIAKVDSLNNSSTKKIIIQ